MNAAYELGVRHALRPRTTIIIAESQFEFPFDVNHIAIRTYEHDGKALDIDIALEFKEDLTEAIRKISAGENVDSPVYTFLPLTPPSLETASTIAAGTGPAGDGDDGSNDPTLAMLLEQAATARASGDLANAKQRLQAARLLAPKEAFVTQQLALVTYKANEKDVALLEEARGYLAALEPPASNDAETLGLWGAVHKRLWEATSDASALDTAIAAYEKGYSLLGDYYNGINYAFVLNVRSAESESRPEKITDFVLARRVREHVLELCQAELEALEAKGTTGEPLYWALATLAEVAFGLGEREAYDDYRERAKPHAEDWMLASTDKQIATLESLLTPSPLDGLE